LSAAQACPYFTVISLPFLSASQYIAALAAMLQTGNSGTWEFCNKAPVCRK